jgi:non-specific serine/threonine protein kinase/serine/threonine-protein kinase
MADQGARCPECGADLSSRLGPAGLCAECLLQYGLAAAEDEGALLVADDQRTEASRGAVEELTGTLGPYRILQKIGEGGMGEVYEAEQTEPIRRRVAVKVIKAGMDSKQVIARFESERQALALMDHPNIARVHDAGTTPQGRPCFVMEYVKGVPITEYCDRQRLTTEERIELFTQVCDGIQHAHQKGVIHRDIKPSNVLVMLHAGEAVPKIIDFGVAKATAQPLTERTFFTELGVLIGTPAYMSPEQAELTALDIDTRTDVYSLGVLFYELLVGALPFDAKELREAAFDEIRRRIREEEPSKPSARLTTLGEASKESAERRRTDLSVLIRELRGDLDWITMKALEKDRARRYASPNEFAADLRRHLNHQPVLAGPPSAAYRAKKFIRRHRVGVGFAAAVVLLLAILAVTMTVQAARIARERDRANREAETSEQVSQFLVDLFKVSNPNVAQGNTVTARKILDRGAQRIRDELKDQPQVQARLMHTLGVVYRDLGLYEPAAELLEKTFESRRDILGDDHPATLESVAELAWLRVKQGRNNEAEPLYQELVEARVRILGEDDLETLNARNSLANLYRLMGRHDESERLFLDVLERKRRLLDVEDPAMQSTLVNLAVLYREQDRYEDSERLLREAVDLSVASLGPDHPTIFSTKYNLGWLLHLQGRLDEALLLIEEVLEGQRRVLGEDHADTLNTANGLANLYRRSGKNDRAEPLFLDVIDRSTEVLGRDNRKTLYAIVNLAVLYRVQERFDEAEPLFLEALEGMRRAQGAEHPQTLVVGFQLARMYMQQKRWDDAERLARRVLEARLRVLGEGHRYTHRSLIDVAFIRAARGDREAALELLRRARDAGASWEKYGGGKHLDADMLDSLRNDPEFSPYFAQSE